MVTAIPNPFGAGSGRDDRLVPVHAQAAHVPVAPFFVPDVPIAGDNAHNPRAHFGNGTHALAFCVAALRRRVAALEARLPDGCELVDAVDVLLSRLSKICVGSAPVHLPSRPVLAA